MRGEGSCNATVLMEMPDDQTGATKKGASANTRDVKKRCEEDKIMRRTEPTEEEMGQKQKVNVWRSLMSL